MPRTADHDNGFSLVELMIVVLIIGILMTTAVPVYTGAVSGAYQRACQANQRMIYTAVVTAQSFNEDESEIGTGVNVLDAGSGWGNVLIPNYLSTPPQCRSTGGGLYVVNPAGHVLSDKGAGGTNFVNQGRPNAHRLPFAN